MAKMGIIEGRMRVAVVDDDADIRLCFKDILQSENKFAFAGGFSSASEALSAMPHLQPDLALVDINLPDMDGIECTKRLMRLKPRLRVVIISGNRETTWFDRSLEAGAAGYLVKPVDPDQLLATLRFVAGHPNGNGNKNELASKVTPAKAENGIHLVLNPREREVLKKLAEGLLYKEISAALGISYTAVHKCQNRIFRKLKVTNRSEATRLWMENNFPPN